MDKCGNMEEFQLQEDFETWVERLELSYYAGKQNKTAIFLTLIGSECYKVFKSLCNRTRPKDVEF